ncbi:20abb339-7091-4c36-a494-9c9a167f8f2b [Thermothielavioides terrestris]|uniref:20abb339-7091-4c36-a494-9c9a167f8f2b n=1 Tax=Thermothielavioides terrestris TaxID=2587410 RepID=A0A446BTC7_9PEZI|nr:20abb339-7091-4c36-a494-9c9a167f8f2b [Thermothielavioides terrestris]
MIEGSESV